MRMRPHPVPALFAVLPMAVMAGDGLQLPESDLAAPGAPLYQYAVDESVRGLMSKQEQEELGAAGRPPSPGPDYYWCENCKAYHKRPTPAGANPPASPQPGGASVPGGQPGGAGVSQPPPPGPDSYWCEQCRTYHLRQNAASQGRSALSNAAPAVGASPASPTNGDYYYCDQCKTYHRRQPAGQQPLWDIDPSPGGGSNVLSRDPHPHVPATTR